MISSKIESLGVYLPEKKVSTKELVDQMSVAPAFDLEELTGIKERRWRSESEDSHTLAMDAATKCLAKSKYQAEELDIIIVVSITRFVGGLKFRLEPTLSLDLKKVLGFRTNAINFDITNACAGMHTGLYILDNLIKSGAVKNGMVVSGECITPIAETAIREISRPIDSQFASLTVGDSGTAIIMDEGADDEKIESVDLLTIAQFSDLCMAGPSKRSPGVSMRTRAMELHAESIGRLPITIENMLEKYGYSIDQVDHVITHQTSIRAIEAGIAACTAALGKIPSICNSLAQFGNTSSTSHFVVLADYIKQNKIKPKQRVLMLVQASGIVMGSTMMTVGNLGGGE